MTEDQMTTRVYYGRSIEAWEGYEQLLGRFIDDLQAKKVCDIGGGANPLLTPDFVKTRDLEYSILDISEAELMKGPVNYHKIVADVASRDFAIENKFDLVFSKMLLEHLANAEQFHKNVLTLLNHGGMAIHFFPTLYTVPFLVNLLAPEFLAKILYNAFGARDKYQHAKFTAYYRWCRGPSNKQIKKYISLGYEVVEYGGFFGHSGYYQKTNFLRKLHELKTDYLTNNPSPYFTSYAFVVLRKA